MGLLTIVTFLPLLGIIWILLQDKEKDDERVKRIALGTSIVTFIATIVVLALYDKSEAGLQLVDRVSWIPAWGIEYHMGVDGLSILHILLTSFISMLAIASSSRLSSSR